MRWPARSTRCVRCSHERQPHLGASGSLPGGHPRSQQAATKLSRDRVRAEGRRLQPAVRRSPHGLPTDREWPHRGRELYGLRMRHLESVGVADDGEPERKNPRRSARSVRAVSSDDYAQPRTADRRPRQADRACGYSPVSDSRQMRQSALAHVSRCGRDANIGSRRGVDRMKQLPIVQPPTPSAVPASASEPQTAGMIGDPGQTAVLRPRIIDALSTVFDPEIQVNIYELGLIYDIIVDRAGIVGIRMTLTAPACPAAQSLPLEVKQRVSAISGVTDVKVDVVWDPPWDRDRMSDAAKLQLVMF